MATYNRAHLIGEMLDSILKQSYPNWECIIVNDGGTDNTDEIVNRYVQQDTRFSYYYRPSTYGKGLPGCRNYGLDMATGSYIVFFDDDDVVHPDLMKLALEALAKYPEYDFCHYPKMNFIEISDIVFPNETFQFERYITKKDIDDVLMNRVILLASCTLMWRRDGIGAERFNDRLQFAEEWEFYTRLILRNKKGVMISNTLYYNRKHHESNTGKYWSNDPIKVQSKLDATLLIAKELYNNQCISVNIQNYLVSICVGHSSISTVNKIAEILNYSIYRRIKLHFSYYKIKLYRFLYKNVH